MSESTSPRSEKTLQHLSAFRFRGWEVGYNAAAPQLEPLWILEERREPEYG
jgi:hypothetical protein